ncbi:MAG: DUF5691 domain-containing protein [Bacteroidia bacterium]
MDKTLINWEAIKSSATAGINRIPLPQNQSGETLLQQLAWQSLKQKAGFQQAAPVNQQKRSPKDEQKALPSKATTALVSLIRQSNEDGIYELLRLAQSHNLRVSASLLPLFLDWALRSSISSDLVLSLVGERGKWLAAQHPDWKAFLPLPDQVWEEGNPNEQSVWLTALRKTDPKRARELLTERLPQTTAKVQAQLLASLQVNLSDEDEELLDDAYHHKRKEVRQSAALLLSRLPNSAFITHLKSFVDELWKHKNKFDLHLSDEHLPVLKAFELAKLPQAQLQLGEKNRMLAPALSVIPLAYWEDRFDLSPARILSQIDSNQNGDWIRASWLIASVHQNRSDWALALLDSFFVAIKRDSPELVMNWIYALPDPYLPALVALLDETAWESLLKHHLSSLNDESSLGFWIRFLKDCKRILPKNIVLAFGQRLVKIIARQYNPSFWLRQSMYHLSRMVQWFPAETYLRLAQLWATDPFEQGWHHEQLESALKSLAFRYELDHSFKSV